MNISGSKRPIVIKFYLNQHLGGGNAALGFGPDQIETLVSMTRDSSHRVISGKILLYTLQTVFVGGYTVFTLSIRPCVRNVLFP